MELHLIRLGLNLQTSAKTTGDEYIRVGIMQETSTYECLEVRTRVHMTGDEYIQLHIITQKQETTTTAHTSE